MSIKERVERDKQLEAAELGGARASCDGGSSGLAHTNESSYAPSGVTYNSMEPMEKLELAAAAVVGLGGGLWQGFVTLENAALLVLWVTQTVRVYKQQGFGCAGWEQY